MEGRGQEAPCGIDGCGGFVEGWSFGGGSWVGGGALGRGFRRGIHLRRLPFVFSLLLAFFAVAASDEIDGCGGFFLKPKPQEPSRARPPSERRHGRQPPARPLEPSTGTAAPLALVPGIPVRAEAPAAPATPARPMMWAWRFWRPQSRRRELGRGRGAGQGASGDPFVSTNSLCLLCGRLNRPFLSEFL